ncbi:hypothetical protein CEP52_000841 [Fusarium oligoseptatum]|uniref:Major facilitator superfamily (MFS) profile domain-containing protein n=1 Tax=Fusarium oligoseptatum TaxID=2604345 RepID=A0A428ULT6_9HYPO|nr:hypothetical protein CEP52_000841 [Fusarium oligoseptatum]
MPPYQTPAIELELEPEYAPDVPLLDLESPGIHDDAASDVSSLHSHTEPTPNYRFSRWGIHSPRRIVILVSLIKFSVVFERHALVFTLCSYSGGYDVSCQIGVLFMAGTAFLSSVFGLMVAFPYGMMSDKIGRKPTLLFSYSGVAVSFLFGPAALKSSQDALRENPYILLWGCVFQIFGGGIPVMLNTLYAVAADVSTEQDKAKHFLWLTFGSTAGGITGPVISGLLMQKYGPWVPIYLVMATVPVVLATLALLPETLTVNLKNQKTPADRATPTTFKEHMTHGLDELIHSLNMLKNLSVVMILVTFFIQNARFTAYMTILGQYISKHFKWKLAEVSILLSPLGILNLIILGGLPKIADILVSPRFRMTPFGKDLFLTRVSTGILAFAAFFQGSSHNIVLFLFGLFIGTFGAADSPLARATVTHYVPPEFTSRLYALIGMIEVIGSFIAGPVLAWCFDQGLKRKGFWMGLPWYYISFLCTLAWVALLFVKPPRKHSREDPRDTDEDDAEEYMPDAPLRLQ